jgi:hypothetical protein
MTARWPRLAKQHAIVRMREVDNTSLIEPLLEHPEQTFGPIGPRVPSSQIRDLREGLLREARAFGFPDGAPSDPVAFDRAATLALKQLTPMSWSEAASRDVWSFLSVCVLADLTHWRWGQGGTVNEERWIASDLTRHAWARLWWRGATFDQDLNLLEALSESDLNQLLERRSIGGNPRLAVALGRSVTAVPEAVASRRDLIRDAAKRLRRLLAFIDPAALDAGQCRTLTDSVVAESLHYIGSSH